jgi:hypothetical protein
VQIPYCDGFSGSYEPFFCPEIVEDIAIFPKLTKLWKLHGSLGWDYCEKKERVVKRHHSEGNILIYPSHLKYHDSRKQPHISLIDRIYSFLQQPDAVLITCGYSFRDEHLNANILDSLQGNSTAVVFALVHGNINNYPKAIQLANSIPNFNLLAENESIIGTKRLAWIEKDNPDGPQNSAIEWVDDGKTKKSKFKLGDFKLFGALLEDIIGSDNGKGLN